MVVSLNPKVLTLIKANIKKKKERKAAQEKEDEIYMQVVCPQVGQAKIEFKEKLEDLKRYRIVTDANGFPCLITKRKIILVKQIDQENCEGKGVMIEKACVQFELEDLAKNTFKINQAQEVWKTFKISDIPYVHFRIIQANSIWACSFENNIVSYKKKPHRVIRKLFTKREGRRGIVFFLENTFNNDIIEIFQHNNDDSKAIEFSSMSLEAFREQKKMLERMQDVSCIKGMMGEDTEPLSGSLVGMPESCFIDL